MRKSFAVLSCVGMAGLLSACSGSWDVDGLKTMQSSGSAFDTALKNEYVTLASREKTEYDWTDTAAFVSRGKEAAMGASEQPEMLSQRSIPDHAYAELEAARAELMSYMTDSVKKAQPAALAKAQASFECWMQEQEENWQEDDIKACRVDFEKAIAMLKDKPAAMMDNSFTVYFGLNSAKLEGDAMAVIEEAATAFKAIEAKNADVAGHADSSGAKTYNDAISALRAKAVSDALVKKGIPENAITISAFGEADQAVKTPDGQKEPRNRRVTISLSK